MAVNRPHVHTAWKTEHPEAGTEHVISILKDRKSQVELSGKGGRRGSRVGAYSHHLTAGSLDCIQLSLQLHELLLTSASSASFIEVDDQLGAAEIGQRHRAPIAGRNRVGGHGRPHCQATASATTNAGACMPEMRDGDKRGNEDYNAACDCVRPPLAIGGADRSSPGLRLRPSRRRSATFLAHRASLLVTRSTQIGGQ